MTTEMGPRDVDLSPVERVAARSTAVVVRGINVLKSPGSIRFNPRTATLSITGESEHAGDPYERGQLAALMVLANAVIPAGVIGLLTSVPVTHDSTVATLYFFVVLFPVALFAMANVHGSMTLINKTDVVDHTTEPLPEALTELQAAYVDGDISEADLERQVGEVMQREG